MADDALVNDSSVTPAAGYGCGASPGGGLGSSALIPLSDFSSANRPPATLVVQPGPPGAPGTQHLCFRAISRESHITPDFPHQCYERTFSSVVMSAVSAGVKDGESSLVSTSRRAQTGVSAIPSLAQTPRAAHKFGGSCANAEWLRRGPDRRKTSGIR